MKIKQMVQQTEAAALEAALVPPKDVSVSRLIDDGLCILYREIKALDLRSAKGKLDPDDAKDLRDHLKMLFELQARENESLKGLSDEQLAEQAKEALK